MPKFKTVRFGELEYRQEDVVVLPDGLVGMPHLRNWLIMDMGEDNAMKWFQSLDRGDFGFPVTQPVFFLDDYEFELDRTDRERIGNQSEADLAVMIITTVHPGGDKVTGNMLAPLVIDASTRKGLQLTLDGDFSLRQEIDYFKFGLAVKGADMENELQNDAARSAAAGQAGQELPGRAGVEAGEPVGV